MNIPSDLKFRLTGFSNQRVAYVLTGIAFCLVPAHYYVSCEISGTIVGIAMLLFLGVGVLSFFVPRGTQGRFRPLAFAFVALVAHMLSTH